MSGRFGQTDGRLGGGRLANTPSLSGQFEASLIVRVEHGEVRYDDWHCGGGGTALATAFVPDRAFDEENVGNGIRVDGRSR